MASKKQSSIKKSKVPDWWSEELYSFVEGMPLRGWCWEFYRRSRLRELLSGGSVDAMNSDSDFSRLAHALPENVWGPNANMAVAYAYRIADPRDLYKRWKSKKRQVYNPLTIPSSIQCEEFPEFNFKQSRHSFPIESSEDKKAQTRCPDELVTLKIDFRMADEVILKDFMLFFGKVRKKYRAPKERTPKPEVWTANKVLMVWDLRQLGLSWGKIIDRLFSDRNRHCKRYQICGQKSIRGSGQTYRKKCLG